MRVHFIVLAGLATAHLTPAWAQSPDPAAVQAPIKGSDVLDGKNRSGPDGWSWAPQTRDQASTGDALHRNDPNSKPGPAADKNLKPGDDPGTPVAANSNGPATNDAPPLKKP